MRARIIIYDDMMILDETEVISKKREQIKSIAVNFLKTTPDACLSEVWIGGQLAMKFKIYPKGKIKELKNVEHSGWGGAREGCGRPKKGNAAFKNRIVTYVNVEMYEYVESKNNKCEWIRQAIKEKMEREQNKMAEQTLDN